jgi:hypothetical protein
MMREALRNSFARIKVGLSAVLAVGLTCCVSAAEFKKFYVPDNTEIERVSADELGVLVLHSERYCDSGHFIIEEVITGRKTRIHRASYIEFGGAGYTSEKNPTLFAVRPGAYIISEIQCMVNSQPYVPGFIEKYQGVNLWISPTLVGPGQIVYPGSITNSKMSGTYGEEVSAWEKLWGQTRSTQKYNAYGVEDKSDLVKAFIREQMPELSDRLTVSLATVVLEKEKISEIVDEVYSVYENNPPATQAEAQQVRQDAHEEFLNRWVEYARPTWEEFLSEWLEGAAANLDSW